MAKESLLEVKNLYTSFNIPSGEVRSVNGVSLKVNKGEVVGIVGESGSGKSVTAYSIMQILEKPGRVVSGSIKYENKEMLNIPLKQLQKIRGQKISIVFQDSMSSLNPVWSIGNQLREVINVHQDAPIIQTERNKVKVIKQKIKAKDGDIKQLKQQLKQAKKDYKEFVDNRCLEMLRLVGINEPEKRLQQYPFEFSGGMLQRIMIAMALICEPDLIIADEPTTALDVTIQAQILELLLSVQKKMNMGIIIITHDLGVVAQVCDKVNVMYAGRIVESGTVRDIFYNPKHEYTKGLINSIPKMNEKVDKLIPIPGNPVDVFRLPSGCSFSPRCEKCMAICLKKYPSPYKIKGDHITACFNYMKEQLDEGKISEEQFNEYLSSCQEGNKAVKNISRLDVYEAYLKYQEFKNNFDEEIAKAQSDEEKEIIKFRLAEEKRNYLRSKKDLAVARQAYKNSKSERFSIDKNDVAKKIKHHKKQIKSDGSMMSKEQFDEYLNNLIICTTPVDHSINKQVVDNSRQALLNKKQVHRNAKYENELAKVEALTEIDELKVSYEKAIECLRWKKYIDKKLLRIRHELTSIYQKVTNSGKENNA